MKDSSSSTRVSLDIPPRPQFVALARLALTALCREHAFSDDEIADLKLAITEACSNSIKHGYAGEAALDPAARVNVIYEVGGDRMVIRVRDRGPGFDWQGPAAEELPEGGLGISIIQAVCDEFSVSRPSDGVGAELTLSKLRRAG